jgi:hypothetical protein
MWTFVVLCPSKLPPASTVTTLLNPYMNGFVSALYDQRHEDAHQSMEELQEAAEEEEQRQRDLADAEDENFEYFWEENPDDDNTAAESR